MCIWCGLLQKLQKIKNLTIQIVKYLLNCKDTSHTILKRFQNVEYSRIWMCIWNGPFQNLNWSLKNQKSELFLWNLMVKYWSDRVKFWIYTTFRAFQTPHQLLALAVVYRLNREIWVWVKKEDALTVVPVLIFLLYMFLNFGTILTDDKMNNIIILQYQKPWCFSPINFRVQSGHQFLC